MVDSREGGARRVEVLELSRDSLLLAVEVGPEENRERRFCLWESVGGCCGKCCDWLVGGGGGGGKSEICDVTEVWGTWAAVEGIGEIMADMGFSSALCGGLMFGTRLSGASAGRDSGLGDGLWPRWR